VDDAAQDLQALIRAKLASEELPSAKAQQVWASKGMGQPCTACGNVIPAHDVEYEVDLPSARAAMRLHRRCIMIWDQIVRNEAPPSRGRDIGPDIA
jgi:hypothetical protein